MGPGDSEGKASAGARFRPPPASIWNNMVDAGRQFALDRLSSPGGPPLGPRETDIIKVKNDCGEKRGRWEVLKIEGAAITTVTDENKWLLGVEPTANCYFGILKEPADIDEVASLHVSGVCMALVTIVTEGDRRADINAAEYVLTSGSSGPIEILYAPAGTGVLECVVRFASAGSEMTAFATITESGENDEFQTVTLYRKAIPDTFTVSTCGTMDFDDMQFTLSESMGTETVLVPAGYKGGEALLIKWNVGVTEHLWSGWAVVAGPTLRCKLVLEKDPVCCPTTQLIKNETKIPFWFFGKVATTIDDPCP